MYVRFEYKGGNNNVPKCQCNKAKVKDFLVLEQIYSHFKIHPTKMCCSIASAYKRCFFNSCFTFLYLFFKLSYIHIYGECKVITKHEVNKYINSKTDLWKVCIYYINNFINFSNCLKCLLNCQFFSNIEKFLS